MSDEEARIREALAGDKPQPGELHDAAIRRAMRATASQLAASAQPASRRRPYLPAAIAAGAVLVFGGGFLLQSLRTVNDDVMRGSAPEHVISPAQNAELAAPPTSIRWPALAGATSYQLTILSDNAALLWRSEPIAATQVALPEAVRAELKAGKQYMWGVTVSGQADVTELGPYVFRVR